MEFIARYWLEFLFGIAVAGLTIAYRHITKRLKDQNSINNGVMALLRDRIVQAYNHYMDEGYCPIYARENIEGLYREYHALGGNGTITDLLEKLHSLPTEKGCD